MSTTPAIMRELHDGSGGDWGIAPPAPTTDAIQRWKFIEQKARGVELMHGHPDGQWVRYDDHLPVQQERDTLKAENARLTDDLARRRDGQE